MKQTRSRPFAAKASTAQSKQPLAGNFGEALGGIGGGGHQPPPAAGADHDDSHAIPSRLLYRVILMSTPCPGASQVYSPSYGTNEPS